MHFLLFDDPRRAILLFVALLLSLTLHEFAHAWSAFKLGDDTAARAGRLSLNPLVHADPIGTVLFPLLGVPFGWAKPVPVNPARFRREVRMGTGMAITAAAGPLSNVALAVAAAVTYGLLARFAPQLVLPGEGAAQALGALLQINVVLALFNLIPIPPLDGSRIVDGFLPYDLRPGWERFASFAPFLLVAVIFFGWRIISVPAYWAFGVLESLIHVIATV